MSLTYFYSSEQVPGPLTGDMPLLEKELGCFSSEAYKRVVPTKKQVVNKWQCLSHLTADFLLGSAKGTLKRAGDAASRHKKWHIHAHTTTNKTTVVPSTEV